MSSSHSPVFPGSYIRSPTGEDIKHRRKGCYRFYRGLPLSHDVDPELLQFLLGVHSLTQLHQSLGVLNAVYDKPLGLSESTLCGYRLRQSRQCPRSDSCSDTMVGSIGSFSPFGSHHQQGYVAVVLKTTPAWVTTMVMLLRANPSMAGTPIEQLVASYQVLILYAPSTHLTHCGTLDMFRYPLTRLTFPDQNTRWFRRGPGGGRGSSTRRNFIESPSSYRYQPQKQTDGCGAPTIVIITFHYNKKLGRTVNERYHSICILGATPPPNQPNP